MYLIKYKKIEMVKNNQNGKDLHHAINVQIYTCQNGSTMAMLQKKTEIQVSTMSYKKMEQNNKQ